MLFLILFRTVALLIAGYFILFAATRADERLQAAGRYLGIGVFVFAGVFLVGSLAMPALRGPAFGGMGVMRMHMMHQEQEMHGGMMGRGAWGPMRHQDGAQPGTDGSSPAPATPEGAK